jgi:hypothetical protein
LEVAESAQQSGRTGRDGKESTFTIITTSTLMEIEKKLAGKYSIFINS